MNSIVIEFSPEDRARLDRLADLLASRQDCAQCARISAAYAPAIKAHEPIYAGEEATNDPDDVPDCPHNEQDLPAPTKQPSVTHDDILAKVRDLSRLKKKDAAREAVTKYAAIVSDIPAESLQVCYDELCKLMGDGHD